LKSDGTVVAWGYDGHGQTEVPAELSNVAAIAAGGSHSLALPQDADVLSATRGDGQSAAAGSSFTAPLRVKLVDAFGHGVVGAVVRFSAPGSGAGGTFAGVAASVLVATDANGFATAPAFTANDIAGGYQVNASAGAATTSFTLSNTPGPASLLAFVKEPSTATAGQALSFQVDVEDSFGNIVSSDDSTVMVTANGPGTFTSGHSSVQARNGVATFTDLVLEQLGSYSLTASDGTLTQASSSSFPLTFSDTFTQNSNSGLSTAWTIQAGNFTVFNQAAAGSGAIDLATVNAVLPQSDADLSADVSVTAVGQEAGLAARYGGPGDQNDYEGELSDTASGFVASLVRNVNGVRTILASQSAASGSGSLRLVVSGSSLELFFNSTLVASANDVALGAGGLGMRATAGATLDNFTAAAALAFSPPPSDQAVFHTSPPDNETISVSNPANANLTWRASAVPAAAVVLQRYGLTAVNGNGVVGPGPVDLFQGLFGAGVDWLLSSNGSNTAHNGWYHLFPDGTLRAWNGSSDPKAIASEPVLATLDPSYYVNPVIQFGLATLADATAKATATRIVNQYDLIYNGTSNQGHGLYYQDLFGVDWLFSANGSNAANGGWYQLFPDGTLRAWNGSSNVSSEAVLGQVSPMLYQDPDLLVSLPYAKSAYNTEQTLALTGPISNFQNAYGQNEIWFKSANGTNAAHGGYYQLLPDGTLHPWNGVVGTNISTESTFDTLGTGTARPDSSYWYNPSLLVNALPAAGPPSGVNATITSPTNAGANVQINGYQSYAGTFGVRVDVTDGSHTITQSFLVKVTDTPQTLSLTSLNGTPTTPPVVPTETVVHTNVTGSALFGASDADTPQRTPVPSAQAVTGAYAVDEALGLITKGDYAPNLFGYNAKWLFSTKGFNSSNLGWYNLFSDGTIRPWSGSSDPATISKQPIVATLDASLWSNPDLLATGDAAQAAWNLVKMIDLTGMGSYTNAYGFDEKWLQSANGSNAAHGGWYQITPDGVVHQWDGGKDITREPVVGTVNGSYWYNPNLLTSLFGAPQPAQPPSGITPTVGGTAGAPTVTLSGSTSFLGTFGISTTFSDGPSSATADFLVQTIKAPLTLANPGTQPVHLSASPALQVTLTGSDPERPAATLTYQAAVFSSMLDAQAFAVTQALGLTFAGSSLPNSLGANEKWLKSSNGNNAAHDGWYVLLPNGDLRLYDGTASGPLVASFSTGAGNSTYWNDPSTLLQPTPVADVLAGVKGNVATFFGFTHTQINMSFYAAALVGDGVATAWTLFAIGVAA
jgi:hypothetical protein